MLLRLEGSSDFKGALAQALAFDCLVADGEDLRKLPLTMRKTNLARL